MLDIIPLIALMNSLYIKQGWLGYILVIKNFLKLFFFWLDHFTIWSVYSTWDLRVVNRVPALMLLYTKSRFKDSRCMICSNGLCDRNKKFWCLQEAGGLSAQQRQLQQRQLQNQAEHLQAQISDPNLTTQQRQQLMQQRQAVLQQLQELQNSAG